jgi:hypothetical protein
MPKTVGRLKQGDLLIANEVDERVLPVTNGLTSYFPMDGLLTQKRVSPNGLRVLYQSANDVVNGHVIGQWLASNGAIMTQSLNLAAESIATIQQYDLVLADHHVWACTYVDTLKTFVDAGVSVVAVGNDTRTNGFVSTYNADTAIRATHDVVMDDLAPAGGAGKTHSGMGSGDIYGGITSLQNRAVPLYYRGDVSPRLITGYYYESLSGAVLYFDQEGITSAYEFVQKVIMWAVNRTQRQITSNNNSLLDNGLCVEETTTNLWSNTNEGIVSALSAGGTTVPTIEKIDMITPFGNKAWKITVPAGNATGYAGCRVTGPSATMYYDGRPYSYYSYVMGDLDGIAIYPTGSRGQASCSPLSSRDIGQWKCYARENTTDTTTGSGSLYMTWYASSSKSYQRVFYIAIVQLEQKSFMTSYVNGSRGEGEFKLTSVLSPNKGSVVVDVTFFEDNSINGLQGADQYCFGNQGTWNAANTWQFHDTDWWYIRDSANVQHSVYMSSPIVRNERTHLVLVYSDVDGTMDIYKNGVRVTDGSKKTAMIGTLGFIGTNWTHSGTGTALTYKMSQQIHGLAFYNRPLTADEAAKLYKSSFKIGKDGTVSSKVKEGLVDKAQQGYYFPLDIDGRDTTKSIVPVTDSNVVYSQEGAYLDKGTVNRSPNPSGLGPAPYSTGWDAKLHSDAYSVSNWGSGYNSGVTDAAIGYHAKWVMEGKDGNACMKFMDINSQFTYTTSGVTMKQRWLGIASSSMGSCNNLGWAVGDVITVSWLQKVDTVGKGASPGIYHKSLSSGANTFGPTRTTITSDRVGIWERKSYSFTIDSDWDLATDYNTVYMYGHYGTEGILWVDDVQVEKSNFMNGFVDGSSGYSRLTYKYSDLFDTPGSGAFTILFWAKYNQSGVYSISGTWPYFYFGNSSSNKVIFSWRENSATTGNVDTQRTTTGATTIPTGQWVMLACSVTIGASISLYLNGKKDGSFTSAFALTRVPTDFEINGISPGDTSYPINGMMKDLMVFRRALSDTEIEGIYKQQMKAYKNNNITIQGKIIEGQVL